MPTGNVDKKQKVGSTCLSRPASAGPSPPANRSNRVPMPKQWLLSHHESRKTRVRVQTAQMKKTDDQGRPTNAEYAQYTTNTIRPRNTGNCICVASSPPELSFHFLVISSRTAPPARSGSPLEVASIAHRRLKKIVGHRLAPHNKEIERTVSFAWDRDHSPTCVCSVQEVARDTHVKS